MTSGKRLRCGGLVRLAAVLAGAVLGGPAAVAQGAAGAGKFEVSFPAAVHGERITGRVFVFLAKQDAQEPRLAGDGLSDGALLFAVDVNGLAPGQPGIVDASAVGSPVRSLREVPAGDYYAQALVNVYTEFHRADGHTIWAHMDQWEGQQFNRSPGNLYSEVRKVHLDSAAGYDVKLSLTKVIPAVEVPADTPWVKHVKMQSEMLTKFWGHPIFLGAVVLLPKGTRSIRKLGIRQFTSTHTFICRRRLIFRRKSVS
jgi:hypothetical protein